MKKSEMLKKLYQVLDDHLENSTSNINLVDFILEKTEEFGMLPPGKHYNLKNSEDKKVGEAFTCHWEPENEEEL